LQIRNSSILRSLAIAYLKLQHELSNSYPFEVKSRVRSKIDELNVKIEENPNEILNESQIIGNISKILKLAKKRNKSKTCFSKVYLIRKVVTLRNECIHTVSEICHLCEISESTYYSYCKINDMNAWNSINPVGRPLGACGLTEMEKKFIRAVVDDPRQSITVPRICARLSDQFQRNVPRHIIYRFLNKKLGYTYKWNSYSAPPAFEPIQLVIRYKISAFLIYSYLNNNLLVAIDESGNSLVQFSKYSYK